MHVSEFLSLFNVSIRTSIGLKSQKPESRPGLQQSIIPLLAVTAITLAGCSSGGGDVHPTLAAEEKSVKVSQTLTNDLHMKCEPVQKRVLATSLHVTGQIHPEFGKEVELTARVPGRVVDILVTPGQQVSAGQTLALIDSQQIGDLEAELIESQGKLDIAKAHEEREKQIFEEQLKRPKILINAKAHFDEAKVQLDLTAREFKRMEELQNERIAAAKDYFVAQANYNKAQSVHRQAVADLQREERLFENKAMIMRDYQVSQAETRHAQKHLNTLKQRLIFLGMTPKLVEKIISTGEIEGTVPITAPLSGLVTHQDVALGEIVDPGKQAFRITDLKTVAISADISEADMANVKTGMKVTAKVTGYQSKTFTGTISYISTHVNSDTRTVPIRASLLNTDLKLKPNMYATIDMDLAPRTVLACPKSAVMKRDAHKVVYLTSGESYKQHNIEVGASNANYYEVISGLTEGDQVVSSGALLLKTEFAGGH
ncbi:MAG: efflux RND transporter periplasmic adaptor subunit [Cyanobacteria bacterium]|nr:efflux RND transporter periplasmic adaptor subunit [Cyanobacteriota bacterium]